MVDGVYALAPLPPGTLVAYGDEFNHLPTSIWRVVELCGCTNCSHSLRRARSRQTTMHPRYTLELPWSRAGLSDIRHDALTPLTDRPDPVRLVQDELDTYWQHASPTGGLVVAEHRHATTFQPGQVIEQGCRWLLVTDRAPTNRRRELTVIRTADGATHTFCANEGARVRTDTAHLEERLRW